jgi:hypothetical protein
MPSKAFPTIQLFAVAGGAKGEWSKVTGPACPHLPASSGSGEVETPPCVPTVDFTHPTKPTARALPTLSELVAWVGARSSVPFTLDMPLAGDRGTSGGAAASGRTLRDAVQDAEERVRQLENLVFAVSRVGGGEVTRLAGHVILSLRATAGPRLNMPTPVH